MGSGRLYANPLADPEAWRRFVGKPLTEAFKGTLQTAGRAARTLTDYANAVVASSDGDMRTRAARYENAPTFGQILDQLHARAGEAGAVGRTFSEEVAIRTNSQVAAIEKITRAMAADKVTPEQVVQAVTSGRAPSAAVARHADAVRNLLKAELDYMREAGVDVGDRGPNYFPREFDQEAIFRNPDDFIRRATAEYQRADGPNLSKDDAFKAATVLMDDIKLGGTGSLTGGQPGFGIASFTRERSFAQGAEAPNRLGPFYAQQDMEAALVSFVQRATKRAEIARRFGDRFSRWPDLTKQMLDEGVSADDRTALNSHVANATGVAHAGKTSGLYSAVGVARTLSTMGQLDQSLIINMSELLMAGVRTGRLDDSIVALGRGLRQWGREIAKLPRDAQAELAESMGIIAGHGHNAIMAARFAAGDPTGRWQEQQLARFFRRIGLEQLTNATRISAAQTGQTFLERLAAGRLGESRLTSPEKARFFLRELGVPDAQLDSFSRFVRDLGDEKMTPEQARTRPEWEAYQTALARFVDQTVMRPDATTRPRWASHPIGAAVFTLNSYAYAFTKNVLYRSLRLAKEGATGSGYTPLDRVAFMAPLMLTLPVFAAGQVALSQLRTAASGDQERERRKTDAARAEDMVKQSGLLGGSQMWLNMATSAAYGRETASTAAGPVFGLGLSFLDTLGNFAFNNSRRTSTAERNLANQGYRTVVEPAGQAALGMLPGGGLAAGAARTAASYALGSDAARKGFVDAVGGAEDARTARRNRRMPVRGVTERIMDGR